MDNLPGGPQQGSGPARTLHLKPKPPSGSHRPPTEQRPSKEALDASPHSGRKSHSLGSPRPEAMTPRWSHVECMGQVGLLCALSRCNGREEETAAPHPACSQAPGRCELGDPALSSEPNKGLRSSPYAVEYRTDIIVSVTTLVPTGRASQEETQTVRESHAHLTRTPGGGRGLQSENHQPRATPRWNTPPPCGARTLKVKKQEEKSKVESCPPVPEKQN